MNESAIVNSKPREPALPRQLDQLGLVTASQRNVCCDPTAVTAARSPADGSVVIGAAIAGADRQRFAQAAAEIIERR